MKDLALADPHHNTSPDDYVIELPLSPVDLLIRYPRVAAKLFDAANVPVASPIRFEDVSAVRSRISLRPNRGSVQQVAVQSAGAGARGVAGMNPEMLMAGLRKHASVHAYMHAQSHKHCGDNRKLRLMRFLITFHGPIHFMRATRQDS